MKYHTNETTIPLDKKTHHENFNVQHMHLTNHLSKCYMEIRNRIYDQALNEDETSRRF
jgi:hypothetical protein